MIDGNYKLFQIDPKLWKQGSLGMSIGTTQNKGMQAATYSNVWVKKCTKVIGNSMVKLEWGIEQNDVRLADDHPIVQFIDDVNKMDNWPDTIRATSSDLSLYGEAYWRIISVGQIVIGYQRLPARWTNPVLQNRELVGFKTGSENWEIEEIIYFHEYHPDNDIEGFGDAQSIVQKVQIESNSDNTLIAIFANLGVPLILLTTAQDLRDKAMERYMRWWKKFVSGIKNVGKVAMVGSGLTATPIQNRIRDYAIPSIAKDNRRAICVGMGVPPGLAGAIETGNRATREQDTISLHEDTIEPNALYIAGIINAKLMPLLGDGLKFVWRFDLLKNLPGKRFMEGQRAEGLVDSGIITREEARDQLDMDARQKWYTKSSKSFRKTGGSANVKFETSDIPISEYIRIKSGLLTATTLHEIKEIFK